MLEGPLDGAAGVPGVHGVVLAQRGVKVATFVRTEEQAAAARGVYDASGAGGHAQIGLAKDPIPWSALPQSDMVLAYQSLPQVGDWRAYLGHLASLTRKVLVVAVANADRWMTRATRVLGRLQQTGEDDTPEVWALGRVRDHAYFEGPWWHKSLRETPTRWSRRLGHFHAFVVDVRPRTPQARRRLQQA